MVAILSASPPGTSAQSAADLVNNAQGYAPPRPPVQDYGSPPQWVAPTGRTFDQIKGTQYLSDAEMQWYRQRDPTSQPPRVQALPQSDPYSTLRDQVSSRMTQDFNGYLSTELNRQGYRLGQDGRWIAPAGSTLSDADFQEGIRRIGQRFDQEKGAGYQTEYGRGIAGLQQTENQASGLSDAQQINEINRVNPVTDAVNRYQAAIEAHNIAGVANAGNAQVATPPKPSRLSLLGHGLADLSLGGIKTLTGVGGVPAIKQAVQGYGELGSASGATPGAAAFIDLLKQQRSPISGVLPGNVAIGGSRAPYSVAAATVPRTNLDLALTLAPFAGEAGRGLKAAGESAIAAARESGGGTVAENLLREVPPLKAGQLAVPYPEVAGGAEVPKAAKTLESATVSQLPDGRWQAVIQRETGQTTMTMNTEKALNQTLDRQGIARVSAAPEAPASSVAGTAPAGADIPPPGAGGPPPPTPPGGERPPLADVGDSGIKAARAAKAESTLPVGRIFGEEGSIQRKVVGVVNPSIDMPREVHVNNQARTAVKATTMGEFTRSEGTAARTVQRAWDADPAKYVGPASRPAKGLLVDFLENPRFYQSGPELSAAKDALAQAQLANVNTVRSAFGGEVGAFTQADPNGIYVPHVKSAESIDNAVQQTSQSLSSRSGVSKTRAYDSLNDRMAKDPTFKPETDIAALSDIHSQSLSTIAANNTFKDGLGKTRMEVMQELHPNLANRIDGLRKSLQSLRGTAGRMDEKVAGTIDSFLAGPMEGTDLAALRDGLDVKVGANAVGKEGVNFGKTPAQMRAEIVKVRGQIKDLQPAWQSAGMGDYAFNRTTFRYHAPAESAAIDSVLKTKVDQAFIDGAIETGNILRGVGLGPDLSPLTIQGALGAFSHPEVAIKNAAGLAKAAFQSPESFVKSLDPELIRRFEFATNRKFGSLGEDLIGSQVRGFKLPFQPIKKFNDALMRVVDYGTIKSFENDAALLVDHGGLSQNVADAEAAHSVSSFIPRLLNAETGRSVQRVAMEGVLPTSRSFTAAPFEVGKDFTSGIAKIVSGRPGQMLGREKLAVLRLTTMAGTLSTASIASALLSADANNLSPADAVKDVLDPKSGHFMSLVLGNQGSVGLGGPFRSAIKGVFNTIDKGPAGGIAYARGRLQPEAGRVVDLGTNRDFRGRPVRSGSSWDQVLQTVKYLAQGINLTVEGTTQGYQQSGGTGAATGAVSQLLGTNYRETTPTENAGILVRDAIQHGTKYQDASGQEVPFPKTYLDKNGKEQPVKTLSDLRAASPLAYDEFLKRNPNNTEARQALQDPTTKEIHRLQDEFNTHQQARDDTLLGSDPAKWRADSADENARVQAAIQQEATHTTFNQDPRSLLDVTNEAYHNAIVAATVNGKVDWDKVNGTVGTFSPDQQRLLFENRLRGDTPDRQQYIKDMASLGDYFNVRDAAWKEISAGDAEMSKFSNYDDFRQSLVQEVHDGGYGWAEARAKVDSKLANIQSHLDKQIKGYIGDNADIVLPILNKYDFYIPADLRKYVRKAA